MDHRISPQSMNSSSPTIASRNSPVTGYRFANGRPMINSSILQKGDSGKDLSASPLSTASHAQSPPIPPTLSTGVATIPPVSAVSAASVGNPSSTASSPTSVASTTRLPSSAGRKPSATSSIADYPPSDTRKQLRHLKSELDSRRLQISDLEHRLSTAQRDSTSKDDEIARLEGQVDTLLQDTKTKYRKIQELQKQMDEMEAMVRVSRAERDNAVMRAEEVEEEYEVKRAEWERAEVEAEERVERGMEEATSVRREMERERDGLRGREDEMRREMDRMQQECDNLKVTITTLKNDLSNAESSRQASEQKLTDVHTRLDEVSSKAAENTRDREWRTKVKEEYAQQLEFVKDWKERWDRDMEQQMKMWAERVESMGGASNQGGATPSPKVVNARVGLQRPGSGHSYAGSPPSMLKSPLKTARGLSAPGPGAASNAVTDELRDQITRLEEKNKELEAANKALNRAVDVMGQSQRRPNPLALIHDANSSGSLPSSPAMTNGVGHNHVYGNHHPANAGNHQNNHNKIDPVRLKEMSMQEMQKALQEKTGMAATITGLSVRVAYLTMLNEVNEESVEELMGIVDRDEMADMP